MLLLGARVLAVACAVEDLPFIPEHFFIVFRQVVVDVVDHLLNFEARIGRAFFTSIEGSFLALSVVVMVVVMTLPVLLLRARCIFCGFPSV